MDNRNKEQEDLDLLAGIFGIEEARKYLLGIASPKSVTPEQVMRDAHAMEVMMRTLPWKIYSEALWRKLMESLRNSLTQSYAGPNKQMVFVSPEQREGYRNQVLAILSVLHLPYELLADKERVKQMRELEREALEKKK